MNEFYKKIDTVISAISVVLAIVVAIATIIILSNLPISNPADYPDNGVFVGR